MSFIQNVYDTTYVLDFSEDLSGFTFTISGNGSGSSSYNIVGTETQVTFPVEGEHLYKSDLDGDYEIFHSYYYYNSNNSDSTAYTWIDTINVEILSGSQLYMDNVYNNSGTFIHHNDFSYSGSSINYYMNGTKKTYWEQDSIYFKKTSSQYNYTITEEIIYYGHKL